MHLTLLAAALLQFRIGPAYFPVGRFPKLHIVIDSGHSDPATLRLLEDGAPTALASRVIPFRLTGQPAAVLLLVDVSGSMNGPPLNAIRGGLSGLMSRARPADRLALASFAEDLRWENSFQSTSLPKPAALTGRGKSTFLFDAIHAALSSLHTTPNLPARRRILLITDGFDEGSTETPASVATLARNLRVPIDCIGVANPGYARWDVLRTLANNTFGSFASASGELDLRRRVSDGLDALLDSPVAEFDTSSLSRDGSVHTIGVELQPAALRDFTSIPTPPAPWWNTLYAKTGALLFAVLLSVAIFRPKKRQSVSRKSSPYRNSRLTTLPVTTRPAPVKSPP